MSRMTPKAAQQMMQTHGHTNIGMAPKPGFPGAAAPPRPIRDIGTGAPPFNPNNPRATTPQPIRDIGTGAPPFNPNNPRATPITPKPMGGISGMRPPGLGTTGGPLVKPRPPGMKKGGKVSSASKRADGIATKGKTKGRMI